MRQPAGVRVLYIAGSGRCGSTLLDRVLGQYPGVFGAGEICHLWERGVLGDGRCGCGLALTRCPVWAEVLDRAFGGAAPSVARRLVNRQAGMRSRHLPMTLTPATWRWLLRRLGSYPSHLEALYRAILRVTGSRLVVDSSKDPLYAMVLASRPSIDLFMVHLVRDPRGAAFSWARGRQETGYLDRVVPTRTAGPALATVFWVTLNQVAAGYGRRHPDRYLAVRYEDLVACPAATVARIGSFVGAELDAGSVPRGTPVASGRSESETQGVWLEPTHSVWGNPSRFDCGAVEVSADDGWRRAMSRRDRAVVVALARPWLARYAY